MKTLGDIKQKREIFYKEIEHISFRAASNNKEDLLEMIGENCSRLWQAISHRTKIHSDKSESDKYLIKIQNAASPLSVMMNKIKKGEKETILNELFYDSHLISSLTALQDACEKAGVVKFGKLTFGAVLDYKPTQKKFIDLSNEISLLVKKIKKLENN